MSNENGGEFGLGNGESIIYKELPKEQKKALQKEFQKTAEAKKMNRLFITMAVIFAIMVIAGAIIGVKTGHEGYFATFPIFFICILPAIVSQNKFEKWLLTEKNIIVNNKTKKGKTE